MRIAQARKWSGGYSSKHQVLPAMRIIRHLTENGPAYAALKPDGTVRALAGDVFSEAGRREVGPALVAGRRLAPIVPSNILGIGLNYGGHAREMGRELPRFPMVFVKTTNAVQDPGEPIIIPSGGAPSTEVDYEAELAVVIGRAARDVSRGNALDYVLGYTAANDVSARDWQFKFGGGQFCHAKGYDTFCPLGPVLVTVEELADPGRLAIASRVNGEVRQSSNTADLIFDVPTLIEFLSAGRTLLPGTVILTGTPSGVGAGFKPPRFLQPGDLVEVELEGVGTLVNPVRAG